MRLVVIFYLTLILLGSGHTIGEPRKRPHRNQMRLSKDSAMTAAELVTNYFQDRIKKNYQFSHFESYLIKGFLHNLIETRDNAYKAPEFWYSRQG